jgi:hypothetical protein
MEMAIKQAHGGQYKHRRVDSDPDSRSGSTRDAPEINPIASPLPGRHSHDGGNPIPSRSLGA